MSPIERNIQLKVLISEEEKEWLTDLADAQGVSASDFVRTLIRRAHQAANQPTGISPLEMFILSPTLPTKTKPKKK